VRAAAGGAGLAARLRWWAGLGAALAAALCSGYSSVAVERLLKMEERAATAEGADSKAHMLEEGSSGDSGDAEKAPPGNSAEPQLPLSAPGGDAVQPPHQEQHHGRPLLTLNLQLAGWGALISALQLVAFIATRRVSEGHRIPRSKRKLQPKSSRHFPNAVRQATRNTVRVARCRRSVVGFGYGTRSVPATLEANKCRPPSRYILQRSLFSPCEDAIISMAKCKVPRYILRKDHSILAVQVIDRIAIQELAPRQTDRL
jgi:hypothetical protein